MASITCPNCGKVIEVDPSSVEDLTRQLRDDLFEKDLKARLAEVGHLHAAELETARVEEQRRADQRVAQEQAKALQLRAQLDAAVKDGEEKAAREQARARQEQAKLQARLDAADRDRELAVERERAKANETRIALQHQLDQAKAQAELREAKAIQDAQQSTAELTNKIALLEEQLATREKTLLAEGQARLLEATSQLERSKDALETQLKVQEAQAEQAQAALREEMARREADLTQRNEEQLRVKDEQIEQYRDDIKRLRDYRMSLSTKLIGESLERHCESEFNRIRMQAYPKAVFEKDNTAIEGTKGDFIFRDYDNDGSELLSIMFEMKTEEENSSSANRKRNEDHFKKLDADRTKKGCEYAVLVSTLEPDNDFYNAGIADVSWRYPKMFVVRPQCFTTIIGLLKAAALTAHPYRVQLERTRKEELDVSTFEEKVAAIVGSIENDYGRAAKNYERAEADIDAIIKKLEDLKKQLKTATTWFGAAQKQSEKLTVKRLTRGNPTMKAAFAEAEKNRELSVDDGSSEPADSAEDDVIYPDEAE